MVRHHFILQGKGGVGKSFIAAQLMQYLIGKGRQVFGYDTDQVNSTFAGYKAFDVRKVPLLEGNDIKPHMLDDFLEDLITIPDGAFVVVDNGAATFLPLCSYMAENPFFDILGKHGGKVCLHTVLTGGQSRVDTVQGMAAMINSFAGVPLVVWLNRYYGEVAEKGKTFEESEVYQCFKGSIHALVTLPYKNMNPDTYGRALEGMLAKRQTYAEAVNDASWNVATRERLLTYQREMAKELDKTGLFA